MSDLKLYRLDFSGTDLSGWEVSGSVYKVAASVAEARSAAKNQLVAKHGLSLEKFKVPDEEGRIGYALSIHKVEEFPLEQLVIHWDYVP
jgi:hypothetical protein